MFFIQISNKNHNQIEFKMILKHIFICFFSLFLLIFILVFRIHFPTLNNMVAFVTATTTACNYDYFYKCFSCSGIKNIELNWQQQQGQQQNIGRFQNNSYHTNLWLNIYKKKKKQKKERNRARKMKRGGWMCGHFLFKRNSWREFSFSKGISQKHSKCLFFFFTTTCVCVYLYVCMSMHNLLLCIFVCMLYTQPLINW